MIKFLSLVLLVSVSLMLPISGAFAKQHVVVHKAKVAHKTKATQGRVPASTQGKKSKVKKQVQRKHR
jgi:hypothetical protein